MNSPFNEAKYKALLEGLEAIEIKLSKTILNKDFRVDSDFWTKEPYKNPNLKYEKIGKILKKAQYGISISMNEDKKGYPIYRMNEIHNMLTDLEVDKYAEISKDDFLKFKLKDRDVLFNRTNSYEWVGRTGIYRQVEEQEFTFASYLVRFIPDENIVMPEYLTTFLNTKYGVHDIKRRSRHSINQTNVNPEEVKEILLPLLNKTIQLRIKECLDNAHIYRLESRNLYNQAETLLLNTLGLKDFQPDPDPINIKSFKESFLSTGRLDAEYYQKKYEEIEQYIKRHKLGFTTISQEFALSKEIIDRTKDLYNYTEISDVNISDGSVTYNELPINDLPDNGKMVLKEGQIIISKVRPYRGAIGIIRECPQNYVGSGAFTILYEKRAFNKEVLQTLLRSKPYKELIMKYNVGSSYPVVKDEDILNLPIPKLDNKHQLEIAELVEESFRLKKQSEQLLETAKRAVEIAIEEGEEKAMEFIKEVQEN